MQFNRFPAPSSFLVWKTRFKTQVSSDSDFPSEAMLTEQWRWMSYNPQDKYMENYYVKLKMLDAKDCCGFEQDHQEFPVQKEGQPQGAES